VRVEQQSGFILHARAWRETSLLLECLTREHGRVGLVARGVRRERTKIPRALLQPLVSLNLGWTGRGELATLTGIEADGQMSPLVGQALLCALYVNELVLRLTLRHDPQPQLYDAYAQAITRLAGDASSAWTLRRFERDLLTQLGYAPAFDLDGASNAELDPAMDYGYRDDFGFVPWKGAGSGMKISGATLLAFASDRMPETKALPALRRLMRHLIAKQLDGKELQAWSMMGSVRQTRSSTYSD
jgi:DNA repair protein RecO (recombination protein O)